MGKKEKDKKVDTKKYEALQAKILEYCERNNLHVIATDMMNKAFLSSPSNPTLFMAEYLLDLNGTNVENLSLKKIANLKSELNAYKKEYYNLKSQVDTLQQRYDALLRQSMRSSEFQRSRHQNFQLKPLSENFQNHYLPCTNEPVHSNQFVQASAMRLIHSNALVAAASTVEDFNLSLSETSDDESGEEEMQDKNNNQPESNGKDGNSSGEVISIAQQSVTAPGSPKNFSETCETTELQPAPSCFTLESLEKPILRYNYVDGTINMVNLSNNYDEISDQSQQLTIDEQNPREEVVNSSASREIEAAVMALEQYEDASTMTYAELQEVEDSLKCLFGSQEDTQMEMRTKEVDQSGTIEDVEQILAQPVMLQETQNSILQKPLKAVTVQSQEYNVELLKIITYEDKEKEETPMDIEPNTTDGLQPTVQNEPTEVEVRDAIREDSPIKSAGEQKFDTEQNNNNTHTANRKPIVDDMQEDFVPDYEEDF